MEKSILKKSYYNKGGSVKYFFLFIGLFGLWSKSHSQTILNGSFEGEPHAAVYIPNWDKCGLMYGNTPDIFPYGAWGVNMPASEGETYLNLSVKYDNMVESVNGIIEPPLEGNKCYKISIDVAVSDEFIFEYGGGWYDFTTPAKLIVMLGDSQCYPDTTIWVFDELQKSEWITYSKIVNAYGSKGGFSLFASHNGSNEYWGHVLVDNLNIQKSGDTIVDSVIVANVGDLLTLNIDEFEDGGYYEWLYEDASCSTCSSASFEVSNDTIIEGVWYDSTQCFNERTIYNILILPLIPNVFTPNGDGRNDEFKIKGLRENSRLYVYNRWGDLVYISNNYLNNWNGGDASSGTYYYVLETEVNEKEYKYSGTINLFR